MTETAIIRETLTQLIGQGRLTGDGLAFDGLPLQSPVDSEYRIDGYSNETLHGCRRHRLIDEALAKLEQGDAIERRIAETFPRWFCFNPRTYPEMVASNNREAQEAADAYSLAQIRLYWILSGRDATIPADFRILDDEGRYQQFDECRVVIRPVSQSQDAPSRWPEQCLTNIKAAIEALRNPSPWD